MEKLRNSAKKKNRTAFSHFPFFFELQLGIGKNVEFSRYLAP